MYTCKRENLHNTFNAVHHDDENVTASVDTLKLTTPNFPFSILTRLTFVNDFATSIYGIITEIDYN
jgi:hypothetical protein